MRVIRWGDGSPGCVLATSTPVCPALPDYLASLHIESGTQQKIRKQRQSGKGTQICIPAEMSFADTPQERRIENRSRQDRNRPDYYASSKAGDDGKRRATDDDSKLHQPQAGELHRSMKQKCQI